MNSVAISTSTVSFRVEKILTALLALPSQELKDNFEEPSRIFDLATRFSGVFLELARALRDHAVVTELQDDVDLSDYLESLRLLLSPFLTSLEVAKDSIAKFLVTLELEMHHPLGAIEENGFRELLHSTKESSILALDIESSLSLITL